MKEQMKILLLLIMSFFFCNNILAEEVEIALHCGNNNKDKVKDERSIILEPMATIDENTIRIYTDVAVSELQLSIKDSMGNVVYTCSDMTSSQCHTFEVNALLEGEYMLEIEIGDESFYGYFSLIKCGETYLFQGK